MFGEMSSRSNHHDFSQWAAQESIQDHERGLYFVAHHLPRNYHQKPVPLLFVIGRQ
jgi:hypothetical protein